MTRFVDGPAAGVSLSLRRAPKFLRVVQNRYSKEWDALDQLDDEPKSTETIHAYRLVKNDGWCHLLIRGKGKRASGFYQMATYAVVAEQPDDATMRSRERWRAWCEAEHEREREKGLA